MDRNIRSNSKRFLLILIIILLVFFVLIIKAFDTASQSNKLSNEQPNSIETENYQNNEQSNYEQNTEENNSNVDIKHHVSFEEQNQDLKTENKQENHEIESNSLVPINDKDQSVQQENEKSTSLTKEEETELALYNAEKLKQNKEYVKALDEYKSILEKNISNEVNAKCYEEMAGIYGVVKRYGTALSYAQKAYSIAPSSNRELLIARLYYKTGDIDKATKKINNILQRDFAIDN